MVDSANFNSTEVLDSNVQCSMSELDSMDPNDSCIVLPSCDRTVAVSCGAFQFLLRFPS